MKKITHTKKIRNLNRLLSLMMLVMCCWLVRYPAAAQLTIPAGSWIIDMGVNSAAKPAGLRPYGMVHELVKYYKVPVLWIIRQGKTKDAVDYTIGGVAYRGGLFVIPAPYVTGPVATAITGWTTGSPAGPNGYTRGLVTARTISSAYTFSGALYDTIKSAPNWTLDAENGHLAQPYYANAGIPASAYNWLAPSQLASCNDIFVMPHAEPSWATHGNLLNWNKLYQGAIWLGCSAGSALENMYNPADTSQQTNFLSKKARTAGTGIQLPVPGSTNYAQNALILWDNHNDGVLPYTTNGAITPPQTGAPTSPDDWVSQFIGVSDPAHSNGREQIYLPVLGQGWRPTTNIITHDPDFSGIPSQSPGVAALIAYGYGFGDTSRGQVMLEAGHSLNKGTTGDVPAQRAFFNWSYRAVHDKSVIVGDISGMPPSGNIYKSLYLSVLATSSAPGVSPSDLYYEWSCVKKSDGTPIGTFVPVSGTGADTVVFDPGPISIVTEVVFTVKVSDPCGRVTYHSNYGRLMTTPHPPVANPAYSTIGYDCYTPGVSTLVKVLDADPPAASDPDNDPLVIALVDPSNPALTGNAFTTSQGSWTTDGINITFTPAPNFFGIASIDYQVCDNTPNTGVPPFLGPLCATGLAWVGVGPVDATGCYPGSVYAASNELGAVTGTQATATVLNPASAQGLPDFDAGAISATAATISTTGGRLLLDYGAVISGAARDSVSLYFGPATAATTTVSAEYSLDNSTWLPLTLTAGSNTSTAVANEISKARYEFPAGGLRYIRITKTAGAAALADAAILEDWTCVDAAPKAEDDHVWVREDTPTDLPVLANDHNPNMLPLTVSIVTMPTHGIATVNTDNTITYQPSPNSRTSDVLTYRLCNSELICTNATVNISILADGCGDALPAQYRPLDATLNSARLFATKDAWLNKENATTTYGTATTMEIGRKLNDFSKRGVVQFDLSALPAGAYIHSAVMRMVRSGGDGDLLYLGAYPLTESWQEASVSWYYRFGPVLGSEWLNAGGTFNAVMAGKSLSPGNTSGSPAGNRDFDITQLARSWYNNPSSNNGLIVKRTYETQLPDKRHLFFARENGVASDSTEPRLFITYQTQLSCATVPNRAPLARFDAATTITGVPVVIAATANDADMDGDMITITGVSDISAGSAVVDPGGTSITYTPNASLPVPHTERLTYTISDGNGHTDQGYVYITITNAPPLVRHDMSTGNSGDDQVLDLGANDADPEGGALSNAVVTRETSHGSYVLAGNTITYTPMPAYYGYDTLVYQRCENDPDACVPIGLCDTALVVFKVNNRPPLAPDTSLLTFTCQAITFNLTNHISDPEGEPMTMRITSGTTSNDTTYLPNGILIYRMYATYTFIPYNVLGTQLIRYVVEDAGGLVSDTGIITITIADPSLNQGPVAVDDPYDPLTLNGVGQLNQELTLEVLNNDYDPEGNFLGLQLWPYPGGPVLMQPMHGTVRVENKNVVYTPDFNFTGTDMFEYVVYDSVAPVAPGCPPPVRHYDVGLVTISVAPPGPDDPIHISGKAWHDRNGSADGTFTGIASPGETGTNAGNALYVYLINGSGLVADVAPVNPDGTYTLAGVPAYESNLKLVLTGELAAVGDGEPAQIMPTGWTHTSPSVTPTFTTAGLFIVDQDWGVQMYPETDNKYDPVGIQLSVGQDYVLDNYPLSGYDPDNSPPKPDGLTPPQVLNGSGPTISTGGTFVITTLPPSADATLYYNSVAITSPGFIITNYDSSLLSIRFNRVGVTITSFTYALVDSAGYQDETPATYTIELMQILPVTQLRLQAQRNGNDVTLNWSTLSEQHSSHFEVERSADGRSFVKTGLQVPAAGNSSTLRQYQSVDRNAPSRLTYYRIVQTDADGRFVYSNTAAVQAGGSKAGIRVYPNPVTQSFHIVFDGDGTYQIELLAAGGQRLILRKEQKVSAALRTMTIDRGNLPAGAYLLKVRNETTGEVHTVTVIVQQQ